ncbi:MAG: hypothetical protein AAB838_04205 [Patescibacteria group bacterium]
MKKLDWRLLIFLGFNGLYIVILKLITYVNGLSWYNQITNKTAQNCDPFLQQYQETKDVFYGSQLLSKYNDCLKTNFYDPVFSRTSNHYSYIPWIIAALVGLVLLQIILYRFLYKKDSPKK